MTELLTQKCSQKETSYANDYLVKGGIFLSHKNIAREKKAVKTKIRKN